MDIGFTREEKEFLNLIRDLVYPYMIDGKNCIIDILAGRPPCDLDEYVNRGKYILDKLFATGSPSPRFDFLRQVAISEVGCILKELMDYRSSYGADPLRSYICESVNHVNTWTWLLDLAE